LAGLLNSGNLDRLANFESGVWRNFAMTSTETLNPKDTINKHSFPLVTLMVLSEGWFGRYRLSMTGPGAELFWTYWTLESSCSFRGPKWVKLGEVCLWILQLTCSAFQCLLIHTISITTVMVTTVQRQRSCGVSGSPEIRFFNGFKTWIRFQNRRELRVLRLLICLLD
jgi:hypothetical protein